MWSSLELFKNLLVLLLRTWQERTPTAFELRVAIWLGFGQWNMSRNDMYHIWAEVLRASAWFAASPSFLWWWGKYMSRWRLLQPRSVSDHCEYSPLPVCFGNSMSEKWPAMLSLWDMGLFWDAAAYSAPSLFWLLHPSIGLTCKPICLELKEVVGCMICLCNKASLS